MNGARTFYVQNSSMNKFSIYDALAFLKNEKKTRKKIEKEGRKERKK